MKLCQEVPDTVSKLKAGSLNLTTVSKLQTYFEKNKIRKQKNLENGTQRLSQNGTLKPRKWHSKTLSKWHSKTSKMALKDSLKMAL